MALKLERITYSQLNSRQRENYNYQKISSVLADYGFVTLRLTDDWQGADFIAQHIDGETFLKVQLKGRFLIAKKYLGKDIYIAFNEAEAWYLYPHDELVESILSTTNVGETTSWQVQGEYSFPNLSQALLALLAPFRVFPFATPRPASAPLSRNAGSAKPAIVAGVDGCSAGWLAVWCQQGSTEVRAAVYPDARQLFLEGPPASIFAIDIPIGLPDRGPRRCDQEARRLLSERRSSVFPAPIRPILSADTWGNACRLARELDGAKNGISQQTWAIVDKIRDVDSLLTGRPALRERVYEVHPEVCFWALNAQRPMKDGKRTASGRAQRQALLEPRFPEAFSTIRAQYPVAKVAHDDIADALVALWTAERIALGDAEAIPERPDLDSVGLPMRMVW